MGGSETGSKAIEANEGSMQCFGTMISATIRRIMVRVNTSIEAPWHHVVPEAVLR
jgi:hypothetical protein